MNTVYDPRTKIWSGPQNKSVYNPRTGLGDVLFHCLKRNFDSVAQINEEIGFTLTYGQILSKTIRIAENLKSHGFKRGDVVALASSNNAEVASILFGSFMIGLAVNTLDPGLGTEDYLRMFQITEPKLIFCERKNLGNVKTAMSQGKISSPLVVIDDDLQNFAITMEQLLKPVQNEKTFLPEIIPNPESETALIVCSSGTTGLPKGVCLSHSLIISLLLRSDDLKSSDVLFSFSSLYWATGIIMLLTGTVVGAKRIITTEPFEPQLIIDIIETYKVTHIFTPPSYAAILLEYPRILTTDFSSIKRWFFGGGAVLEQLSKRFEKYLVNGQVEIVYGLSELAVATLNRGPIVLGSVGKLTTGFAAKIINETDNALGPNETGEICFKVDHPFLCYFGNKSATEEIKRPGGWIHTGDLGYFDDNHNLYIIGRRKEIIKYKNYHISPVEIEEFLLEKLGLMQTCAIGIEDFDHGNDLLAVAVVQNKQSQQISEYEIIEAVEKNLANHKHIRGGVYFIEKFPFTSSGKVRRTEVKKIITEIYNKNKLN